MALGMYLMFEYLDPKGEGREARGFRGGLYFMIGV